MQGLGDATRRVATHLTDAAGSTRAALLPGRSLPVFLASLLGVLSLLTVGNMLTDGAVYAVWLRNLVRHGSLTVVEVPDHYFLHDWLLQTTSYGISGARPRALGYLALPAWVLLGIGSLVGLQYALPAIWSGLLYGLLRTEPAARDRVPRRAAAGVAVGLFAVNALLADPISFDLWGEVLAVQATNAVLVALAAAVVFRLLRARWRRDDVGLLGAAVFLVGPVAFWGIGAKDHALAAAAAVAGLAGIYAVHRYGVQRYRVGAYAIMGFATWAAQINGLIALGAVGLVDLGATVAAKTPAFEWFPGRDAVRKRAVAAAAVVGLIVVSASPYPIHTRILGGGSAFPGPAPPDGGGGGGTGGGAGGGGGGPDLLAPFRPVLDRLEAFFDPILGGLDRMTQTWTHAPADGAQATVQGLATGDPAMFAVPLLVVAPLLVAALLWPIERRWPTDAARRPAGSADRVLLAGAGLLFVFHLAVYGPFAVQPPKSFDYRYLTVLVVPLSILATDALSPLLRGRIRGTALLSVAATVVLVATVTAAVGLARWVGLVPLLDAVRVLGPVAAGGLVLAYVHDRLFEDRTLLPYAVALGFAVPALWLFASTVVFGRGVTDLAGGGWWVPLTGALHQLLV